MKQFLLKLFRIKVEEFVVSCLRELSQRSDNKVDDRLVEAVATAINNGSYLTYIKKVKSKL